MPTTTTLNTVRAASLKRGDAILTSAGVLHVLTDVAPSFDLLEVAWPGGTALLDYDAPVLRVVESPC